MNFTDFRYPQGIGNHTFMYFYNYGKNYGQWLYTTNQLPEGRSYVLCEKLISKIDLADMVKVRCVLQKPWSSS